MPSAISIQSVRLPRPAGLIELKPPHIFDLTQLTDERSRTLQRLLNDGHRSMAPLREPNLKFHSHLPHLLGSAYRLGADSKQLEDAYEQETLELTRIDESFARGDRINRDNWRDLCNQKPLTVAYVDFFDGEISKDNDDWKLVVAKYLYDGPRPIINGLTGGLGHPFIHLAYAYEFNSSSVGTEALSLGCTELDMWHDILDHPPPDSSTYKTTSLADIVLQVRQDARLDGLFSQPGFENNYYLFDNFHDLLLEHWNAWDVVDPLQQLEQISDLSVLLAISSANRDMEHDFFLVHLMTVAHAFRVIWHEVPKGRHALILKEYAMFAISVYVAQLRRSFDMSSIESFDLDGRDWQWVVNTALSHEWALDSHFFKVVCAPKAFAETYGEKNGFYLKAAVKFLVEFTSWTGFGQGMDGFDPAK